MKHANDSAWRKKLQPASFRGVPFKVRDARTTVGRRTVLHEYPQRDTPFTEDMGRKARQFTIEAIILGDDYFKARDALIEALEKAGPGELVHPYYGRRMVALQNPSAIAETPERGGTASFSLDFVEAGENAQPSARIDTRAQVDAAASSAADAAAHDFAGSFSVNGSPEFVGHSALDLAKDISGSLNKLRNGMIPDVSILSEYSAAASGVMNGLERLVRTPYDLASNMLGLFKGLSGLARNPFSGIDALRNLFGYGSADRASGGTSGSTLAVVPATTPARIVQADNQAALVALTQRAAVIEATRASSVASYDSYEQAATLRDELAERLDLVAEQASDPVYTALVRLRVAMVRDINTRGADLAHLSTTELSATLPALVAAHRIYGDARRDADLISRNTGVVKHPGFVPGGRALEILVE